MWFVLSPVLKTEGYPISGSELSMSMVVLESGSRAVSEKAGANSGSELQISEP